MRGDYASAALINKNNIFGAGGTGGTVLKMLDEYRGNTVKTQIKGASSCTGGAGNAGNGAEDSESSELDSTITK